MQNNRYNWWEDPNVPFRLKAEQNLFWIIYEENKSLHERMKKRNEPREKLKELLNIMLQYAHEHGWLYKDWVDFTKKCKCDC